MKKYLYTKNPTSKNLDILGDIFEYHYAGMNCTGYSGATEYGHIFKQSSKEYMGETIIFQSNALFISYPTETEYYGKDIENAILNFLNNPTTKP